MLMPLSIGLIPLFITWRRTVKTKSCSGQIGL